jgi:uncharacterized Zn-binding protein involved in type VI secretion
VANETNDSSGSDSSSGDSPAGNAKAGPHGEKPLTVTEQPKLEIGSEGRARRNLWAKGNRVSDPTKKSTDGSSRKAKAGPLATKIYYDDVYYSTRQGDETSYFELLRAKAQVELWDTSADLDKGEVKLTLAKVKVRGSLAHGQVDLVEALGNLLFPPLPMPVPAPLSPPLPHAARVGDPMCHGNPLGPGSASPDVLIGGLPAWRASIDVHLCAMPGHGSGGAWSGASNVLINGSPAARAGDYVLEPGGGANVILRGESTVLIGPRAAAPPQPQVSVLPEELPWVKLEAILQEDIGVATLDAAAATEARFDDLRYRAELQAGFAVAAAEAELPARLRIRIPGTAHYLGLGVTPQVAALGVGAEAGAGANLDPTAGRFELTAGAKVSLGVGAGIKFSIDVSD